ncbi:MAG: hypothetical protein M3167_02505 [Acidobacteriota bacterium]|nr:hypothetical protein [Acidobacteriota bacterium]
MNKPQRIGKRTVPRKATSIRLPEGLWRDLRIRALEEGRDAQDILAELIERYLRKERRKHGR